MKPLLQIKVPSSLPLSEGGLSGDQYVRMVSLLRTRLLENYEVVIIPDGIGMDITTEGMVNLTIDSSTNFDELFKQLDEIGRLKIITEELKQCAKFVPEGIMDTLNIPNKNGDRYLLDDVGMGHITHVGPETRLAPRGIMGADGKLTILSMDYVVDKDTELELVRPRRQHPTVLFDPFGQAKPKEVK